MKTAADVQQSGADSSANPPSVRQQFATAGWTLEELYCRRERFLLALIVAIFGGSAILRSFRPLWFDELFTFHLSRLKSLHELFVALPADGNPPLNYLLTHGFMAVLGEKELATRMTAIMGVTFAVVAVFLFVWRWAGPMQALLGAINCAGSYIGSYYSHEGRPYGLLLGWTALALVSWQAAARGTRGKRTGALVLLAVAIAGAVSTHHYGVIYTVTFLAAGEGVRLWQCRRVDVSMLAAICAGWSVLVWTIPFAQASQRQMLHYVAASQRFLFKPSAGSLLMYFSFFCLPFPVVFLPAIWKTLVGGIAQESVTSGPESRMLPHEKAAVLALALLVPIMLLVTMRTTGYFVQRYAIGCVLGVSILLAYWCGWAMRKSSLSRMFAQLLVVGYLWVALLFGVDSSTQAKQTSAPYADLALLSKAPVDQPIVIASALDYFPDWIYAPANLQRRIHYLADLPYAVQQPDFLPELSLVEDRSFVAAKVDDYRSFVDSHSSFLLLSARMPKLEWTMDRLKQEGWNFTRIESEPAGELYWVRKSVR